MARYYPTAYDDDDWCEDTDYYEDEDERHGIGWDAEPGDPFFDWSSLSLEDLERMTYGDDSARRDFERSIYEQCDAEDREEHDNA